jgi:hypothetical protein
MIRFRDDEGSMPLAMLLIVVSVTLSTLMTPMVLTQINATRVDGRRVHALHAAQAGIDIAMGHIRAADDGAGNGVLAGLPCGPFSGSVGAGTTARYQVTIRYYREDPRGQTATWLNSNELKCFAGSGTAATPLYALLAADGTDAGSGAFGSVPQRSLAATYIFQTTNQNIPGGLIHIYKTDTSDDLCLDATTSAPAANASLRVQPCDANNLAQIWVYNQNLTISLSASRNSSMPLGMCVDVAPPQGAGTEARLQPCGTTTLPRQQWSINDSANFEGTSDGTNLNGRCLVVQSPDTPGSLIVMGGGGCGGPYDNYHTFSVEASVGAGAAGPTSGQVVNFSQFGRCIDVTEFNPNKGYLIVWPCKQAPDPTKIGWNQRFTMPPIDPATNSGTGQITTKDDSGQLWCLRSPGSTANGSYVTVIHCPANATDETTWTFYTQGATYATSFIAVDSEGYCLAPTDPKKDRYTGGGYNVSKIRVADCDGSTAQKWNAPPNILRPFPLKDIAEK